MMNDDQKKLLRLVEGLLTSSEFVKHGSWARQVKRKLETIERERLIVTVQDALQFINSQRRLVAILQVYESLPQWLLELTQGVLLGTIKLKGGGGGDKKLTKVHVDILGIFEFLRQLGYKKGEIYEALAYWLDPVRAEEPGDSLSYSKGADAMRKKINKARNDPTAMVEIDKKRLLVDLGLPSVRRVDPRLDINIRFIIEK